MLLPVCLDPIQAWTLLKEKATGPALHIALSFFLCPAPLFSPPPTSFLDSLPLSDRRETSNTTGHFTAWSHDRQEFKPPGSPLGLWSNDS